MNANIFLKPSAPCQNQAFIKLFSGEASTYDYEFLSVSSPHKNVLQVELNRPDVRNAVDKTLFGEIKACFHQIQNDTTCRAVVLSGSGKTFCAGIDLSLVGELSSLVTSDDDIARKALALSSVIADYQEAFTTIEMCNKPVIVAVHGGCIGLGTSIITACDVRYCSEDAFFTVKEVDLGLTADVGVLQRMPKIIGNDSLLREIVFTARTFDSKEAKEIGLVSKVFDNREVLISGALETARIIATKSPVAVQGSKINLNYSRDHTVAEGLRFMCFWNMTMLQSEDLLQAGAALISKSKTPPTFSNL